MSSIPAERINQIKQIIHQKYNEMDIQGKIRDVIAEKYKELNDTMEEKETAETTKPNKSKINQNVVLQEIKKKGIVDSVLKELIFENHIQTQRHSMNMTDDSVKRTPKLVDKSQEYMFTPDKVNVDPTKRHLYVHFTFGKAFLEYLNNTEPTFESKPTSADSYFTIHVQFREQRFKTRPFACTCEPKINEGFLIELSSRSQYESTSLMLDKDGLLGIGDKIHIVMIRTDSNNETYLVSSHFLEWRTVLTANSNKQNLSIELMGIGEENKIPAGLLFASLQLVPSLSENLKEDILETQLAIEHSKNTERERLFLIYSKQWWREFLEIRDDHKYRIVKIFAQDENGINRPVCSYVKPMQASRLLDSPRQAARFVSLIPYMKVAPSIGVNDKVEQWLNMHTFLAKNKGDCENHSILLCNLLIGFGLDAYVCIGTKLKNQAHSWVVTISYNYGEIVFWESITGNRYLHQMIDPDDPPLEKNLLVKHPYRTVSCLFNHKTFYANIQPSINIETCSFILKDQTKWKAMSEDAINTVCSSLHVTTVPHLPLLCKNQFDPVLLSKSLEKELRLILYNYRKQLGLTSNWDDNLSYILTPALASYENERLTGLSIGNEEFDQAIRLAIPEGHTFKAFPIQFNHVNSNRIFNACLDSTICEDIIKCRGDQVRLALKTRIFLYPESCLAVWVMFACCYKIIV